MQEKYRRNAKAAWSEIDGLVVIIAPHDSVLHELNEVGSFLWKHADSRTVEQLVELVVAEFEVEPERATADTREFLETLLSKGLIEAAE